MTKTKSKLMYLLTLPILFVMIIILSSCGSKNFTTLSMVMSDAYSYANYGNIYVFNVNYGDTSGLSTMELYANYDDGSKVLLSTSDYTCQISYTALGENTQTTSCSLEEYLQKVSSNTLEAGNWRLVFTYKNQTFEIQINVARASSQNDYNLQIISNSEFNLPQNTISYGAKNSAFAIKVSNGGVYLDSSKFENTLYVLNENENYDNTKSALDYFNQSKLTSFDVATKKPGKYMVAVKILATDNYDLTFTKFVELTINKSQIEIKNENLTLSYEFDVDDKKYNDLTFDDMQKGKFKLLGAKIILCSDRNSENNSVLDYSEKITNEEICELNEDIGSFVPVNNQFTYNAKNNGGQIALKFVPSDKFDSYFNAKPSDLFDTSLEVMATLSLKKGEVFAPYVSSQFGTKIGTTQTYSNPTLQPDGNILKIYADENLKDRLFEIQTSTGCQINVGTNHDYEFLTRTAGNFNVKFVMLSDNFKWKQDGNAGIVGAYTRQFNQTTSSENTSVEFSYTINQVKFTEDLFGNNLIQDALVDNEIPTFDINGNLFVKIGLNNSDPMFEKFDVILSAQPIGTPDEKSIASNATGLFEAIADKQNRYQKFTLASDTDVSLSDILVAVNVTVKLKDGVNNTNSFECNDEWIAFQKTLVVKFNKFDYFDVTTPNSVIKYNSENDCAYMVVQSGETLNSLLSSLPNQYGTWDILDGNSEKISNKDVTISNGSKYVLDFNSNKSFILTRYYMIYIFDHNPTSQDFELIDNN